VLHIVPQIIEYGGVKRAGMGVALLSDNQARRLRLGGVGIREVTTGSAAEKAGLQSAYIDRAGRIHLDIIVAIDDKKIENYNDLYEALENREPGDRVRLRFVRERREHEVDLVLQEIF
jgi:S1-C subfamily serine protease